MVINQVKYPASRNRSINLQLFDKALLTYRDNGHNFGQQLLVVFVTCRPEDEKVARNNIGAWFSSRGVPEENIAIIFTKTLNGCTIIE